MGTVTTSPNSIDYTTDLAGITAALTRIAVATERIADEIGTGGPDGNLSRAMMVNALRESNQLDLVVAEILNPTTLPTGPA